MSIEKIKKEFSEKSIDKWAYIDKMYEFHSIFFDYAKFIQSTNISKIEIENGQVVMTFRDSGVRFICAGSDKRLAPFETFNFGSYEEEELKMQIELIGDKDTVYDVGGNYGWYALHVSKKNPGTNIHSFEPIPDTYAQLQRNINLNGYTNIKALNFGLSNEQGSFTFYYDPSLSVNASLQNVSGNTGVVSVNCKVDTMDDYRTKSSTPVDFIKCDVEGAELLVFKGAQKTLKEDCPIIFSEMLRKWTAKFNYHPNDIIQFLSGFGYKCFVLGANGLKPFGAVEETTMETNYFFLHPVKHADKIKRYSA